MIRGDEHPILAEIQSGVNSDNTALIRSSIMVGTLLTAIEMLVGTEGNPYENETFYKIVEEVYLSTNELEAELDKSDMSH